ncbi:MAG: hypothetical protein ABJN36_06100 [Cyclobacteriaceae bacterium]
MKRLTLFIFFLYSLSVNAQQDVVEYDQLVFKSSFEKEAFDSVLGNNPDYFFGFMTLATDSIMVEQWRGYYELRIKGFLERKRPKNDERYLKNAYQYVHDEFFIKYEPLVNFEKIFQDGVYNCVTACALYGMAFDDFGIPYVVKETPTHVYIIAYPYTAQIRIETTDPLNGYKDFGLGYKEQYVKQLAELKLIDQSDLAEGVNAIFDKFYFTAPNLGLKELMGIHYYNQAVVSYNSHLYQSAFEMIQKAYFLHPSESMEEMMAESCRMMLSTTQYEDLSDVNALVTAMNLDHASIGNPQVLHEFSRLLHSQLAGKNDTAMVETAFLKIMEAATDSSLIEDLGSLYYYERSRMHYNRGNYRKGIPYAIKAYGFKPGLHEAENLMVHSIQNAIVSKELEPDDVELALDSLFEMYPALNNNSHLRQTRLTIYLQKMAEAYNVGNIDEAKNYQNKFEESADSDKSKYNHQDVGHAYSRGVIYYFKKGWYKSARKVLNSGLKYAPNSSELRTRKYYLDRAQNN